MITLLFEGGWAVGGSGVDWWIGRAADVDVVGSLCPSGKGSCQHRTLLPEIAWFSTVFWNKEARQVGRDGNVLCSEIRLSSSLHRNSLLVIDAVGLNRAIYIVILIFLQCSEKLELLEPIYSLVLVLSLICNISLFLWFHIFLFFLFSKFPNLSDLFIHYFLNL